MDSAVATALLDCHTTPLTHSVVLDGVLSTTAKLGVGRRAATGKNALKEGSPCPDRFDPERCYAFIPFGGGAYVCLGAQLAACIAKVFALECSASSTSMAWERSTP